jgi:hypothetical protein
MRDLVGHLERHLGPIGFGWSKDADGRRLPFQIVEFEKGPITGTHVLATLGLSDRALQMDDGRRVRQELVMILRQDVGPRNLPGVMQQVALEALERDRAYLRGEVLGPRGDLVEGTHLQALYVAVPVYFPDGFQVYLPGEGEPVMFAWLVPITAGEAAFVRIRGWNAFEDQLEQKDPDLLDFHRESIA